jgi:DNA-directed RNA polymerase subunit RPC12/RpoP
MLNYNKHDVIGLEQLYLKLRPYIKNHPNLGVLLDEDVCPNCGSYDLVEEIGKYYFTTANKFPVYRCANCKTPYIRHKKNSNMVQTNIRSVPK